MEEFDGQLLRGVETPRSPAAFRKLPEPGAASVAWFEPSRSKTQPSALRLSVASAAKGPALTPAAKGASATRTLFAFFEEGSRMSTRSFAATLRSSILVHGAH